MDQLVDGDFAANNGGWQWSAATGTDAAPYFRVFNPVTQSQRFDPEGHYLRRWVPELRASMRVRFTNPGATLVALRPIPSPWSISKPAGSGQLLTSRPTPPASHPPPGLYNPRPEPGRSEALCTLRWKSCLRSWSLESVERYLFRAQNEQAAGPRIFGGAGAGPGAPRCRAHCGGA